MGLRCWAWVGVLLVCSATGSVDRCAATEVRFFQQQSRKDFVEGELEGLAVDYDGALRRAAHFERSADIEEPFVFSAAAVDDGWILGTGNSGRVLHVASNGDVTTAWTAPEPEVFAVWSDADGTVFAGSSPDGKVYALRDGVAEEVFDPEETYIWAIARAPWGDLLVATGDNGRLYAVAADGEGRLVFDGDETHLRTLYPLANSVLIGTAGDGLIQSIDGEGRVRTLFDAEQTEVVAFAGDDDGGWYAAAVTSEASFSSQSGETSSREAPSAAGDEPEKGGEVSVEVTVPSPKSATNGARSGLVRGDGGEVRPLASLKRETVYSLGWIDGRLWIGTGVEGKVYSLMDGNLALEASLDDRQVVGLFADPSPVLVTTNAAAVHRSAGDSLAAGTYTSQVLDAKAVARFGSLSWRGESQRDTAVRFSVRSGLSSQPDSTWSDWSTAETGREVALADVPQGRFVQWRLELDPAAGPEARIASVDLSYRQNNAEPRIEQFGAMDPGQVLVPGSFNAGDQVYEPAHPNREGIFTTLEPESSSNGGRLKTLWRKGYRTLRWEAEDPNEDTLAFALSFRRDGSSGDWLSMESDIDDSYYSFDATVLPDGVYRFRLEASDRPENTLETALTETRISVPVVVDHSPPVVASVESQNGHATVSVLDSLSPVRSAEVSIDGGEWRPVGTVDGLLDGHRESLEVELPAEAELVLLRVMDAAFNAVTFDLQEEWP